MIFQNYKQSRGAFSFSSSAQVLLCIFLFLFIFEWGLVAQMNHGGQPSFSPVVTARHAGLKMVEMPSLPQTVFSDKKRVSEKELALPLRFAHPFFVGLTPENSGEWQHNADGSKVWRLAINSKGAYSINLIFDRFRLEKGSSLFIFNPNQSVVLGAYTHENNLPSGILATTPVPGDEVIVELIVPLGTKSSDLLIGAVNHDYLNVASLLPIEGNLFGRSDDCHTDLSCESSEMWQDIGQSVCRLIIDGTDLCTGTLVNNTRNDGTPYVLTAAHCLPNTDSHETVIFTFNYQVPNCDSRVEGSFIQTISGSDLRVFSRDMDMTLLEMSDIPPATYRPYWAGWSRTTSPLAPVRTIHHPEGDVKKIARSDDVPTNASFHTFVSNSHWRIAEWHDGTTERGSSGAPLFDSGGLLVGSLSGGSASCGNPFNDYFLRLNKSWSFYTEPDEQLAYWLDPDGSNPLSLDGLDYYDKEVLRWTNMASDDLAGAWFTGLNEGYFSGHNSRQDKSYAEFMGAFVTAKLHGLYIIPAKSATTGTQKLNLKIWQGLEAPESVVWSLDQINLTQVRANKEYLVMLNEPLELEGRIWAGLELSYPLIPDTFALYQSPFSATRVNTAWVKNAQDFWFQLPDWDSNAGHSSYWIDLLLSDVQILDSSDAIVYTGQFKLSPNPARSHLDIYIPDGHDYAQVEFVTLTGQLAHKASVMIYNGKGNMNVSFLRPGLYVVRLKFGGNTYVDKLVISGA